MGKKHPGNTFLSWGSRKKVNLTLGIYTCKFWPWHIYTRNMRTRDTPSDRHWKFTLCSHAMQCACVHCNLPDGKPSGTSEKNGWLQGTEESFADFSPWQTLSLMFFFAIFCIVAQLIQGISTQCVQCLSTESAVISHVISIHGISLHQAMEGWN